MSQRSFWPELVTVISRIPPGYFGTSSSPTSISAVSNSCVSSFQNSPVLKMGFFSVLQSRTHTSTTRDPALCLNSFMAGFGWFVGLKFPE